jgi:hypothetical protein
MHGYISRIMVPLEAAVDQVTLVAVIGPKTVDKEEEEGDFLPPCKAVVEREYFI